MKALIFIIFVSIQTVSFAASYFHPKVAPDNKHISYYGYVEKTPDLFLKNLETGNIRRLTHTPDYWEIEPRWLDNHTLLYLAGPHMGQMFLMKYDLRNNQTTEVTNYQGYEGLVANIPDSNDVIIFRKKNRKDLAKLFRLDMSDRSVSPFKILEGSQVHEIIWSEESMLASLDGDLFLVNFDGQIITNLTQSDAHESYPSISDDLQTLVFVSDENSKSDLYAKNLITGVIIRLTNDEYPEYAPELTNKNTILYAGVETDKMDILEIDLNGKLIANHTRHAHP